MKNLNLVLIFLLFCLQSFGQLDHLDTSFIWKEFWSIQGNNDSYIYFKINGDTSIKGNIYKKAYQSYNSGSYGLLGFVREDSLKRIYFSRFGYDELIYDFSLNLNDSFKYSEAHWYFKVKSVDSILIDGVKKKRIAFDEGYGRALFWIDGIGSSFSLFYTNSQFAASRPTSRSLLCVTKNDSLIYRNPIFANCNPPLAINNGSANERQVKIYPQPVKTEFIIELPEQSSYKLIITDNFGRRMIDMSLNEKISSFNRANLPSGIYYYIIYSKEKIYKGKILFD